MNEKIHQNNFSSTNSLNMSIINNNNNHIERIPRKASAESFDDKSRPSTSTESTNSLLNWCTDGLNIFFEYSTFHGVRDLSNSNVYCLKFTWTLVVLFAILLSLNGCYLIIRQFIEHPVVVSYFVRDAGQNLTLPDVIVCPFNRFNKTYLEQLNITDNLSQYLEMTFPGPPQFSFQENIQNNLFLNDTEIDQFDRKINQVLIKNDMTFNELMKKSAIDCTAFFPDKNLCKTATTLMTSAGKCFRLKGSDQLADGFGMGLKIVITLPKHLYNPGINQMLNDGILVKLAEKNHGVDNDLTFISSGVHAIMPLSATMYDFIDDPPRYSCVDTDSSNYSRLWCFEYCVTKRSEDLCNCSLIPATNPKKKETICTAKQILRCFYPSMNDPIETFRKCREECKPPCKYWKYSKTISTVKFSKEQAKVFAKDNEILSMDNTIILEVFYTNLDYTLIKQMSAMTPSSFIAQIGGQLSLWIGGSLISVVQAIIYLGGCGYANIYKIFSSKLRYNHNNIKNRNSNNVI